MNRKTDLKWWERPLRIVRYDPLNDFTDYLVEDLEAHAQEVRNVCHANCEWMMANGGSAPGTASVVNFDSPHFEKNPTLGDRDILRSYVPVAHDAGIQVIAYINLHWFSYDFADDRPGWEQLLADGRAYGRVHPLYGNGTTLCVNSPWRDYAFLLIREVMRTGVDGAMLDGPVVFPGACYCGACRSQFEEQYGIKAPEKADWSDDWKLWTDFREASMARFLADARRTVEEANPEGIVYLNAGGWQLSTRVARHPWRLEPHQHVTGAEVFVHFGAADESWLDSTVMAKFLSCGRNPGLVFSDHALGGWHYRGMHTDELGRELYQSAAGGSSAWIALFLPAIRHQRHKTLEPVSVSYGRLEQLEPLLTGDEGAARIALFRSSSTAASYISELPELRTSVGAAREQDLIASATIETSADRSAVKQRSEMISAEEFRGWCYLLTRQHLPYDVIRDSHLTDEGLRDRDALVLPAAACLSDEEIAAVRSFVESGGIAVSTFETGWYDENGRLRDAATGGVGAVVPERLSAFPPATFEEYAEIAGAGAQLGGFDADELIPRTEYALKVEPPPNAEIFAWYLNPIGGHYKVPAGTSSSPMAYVLRVGHGAIAYLSCALGADWLRFRVPLWEQLIGSLLRFLLAERAQLRTDAPPTVQIEVRRQPERTLVHVLNNTGDNEFPPGSVLPVRPFSISLKAENASRVLHPDGSEVRSRTVNGRIEFQVELSEQYTIYSITLRRPEPLRPVP